MATHEGVIAQINTLGYGLTLRIQYSRGGRNSATVRMKLKSLIANFGARWVQPDAPRFAPACGQPIWDECGAQEVGEGVEAEPDGVLANQSPPNYPDDQRTA